MSKADTHTGAKDSERLYDVALMKRFLGFALLYKGPLALSIIMLPLISLLSLVQPYIIKEAVDNNMVPRVMDGLPLLISFFLMAVTGEILIRMIHFYIVQSLGQKVIYSIRKALFGHIQKLPISYFEKSPVGKTMNRVTNDVESLSEMVSSGMVALAGDFITIAGIAVAMLLLNTRLALISFIIIPVLVGGTVWIRRGMRKTYRTIRKKLSEISGFIQESLAGIRVVQLFLREEKNIGQFDDINTSYYEATLRSNLYDALLYSFVEVSASFTVAFILWYGGIMELSSVLTFGILVAFIEYLNKIFVPIKDISAKFAIIQAAMAAMERIFSLLDTEPEITAPPSAIKQSKFSGRIAFKDVFFSYGREEVLKNISFSIEAGEKVALVGATGAGKSTIIKLLTRMHDVTGGSVTIDETEVKDMDPGILRRKVGIVQQDLFMFSGTVAENISLGRPEVDEKSIRKAAERVMASTFIEKLPEGYGAEVKEKGVNLSSGQRQLLSLARVMAYDPEILVMDEATSSIDVETEHYVQKGMSELFKGRTAIIIAHRLSTIRNVDRIIVLHKGEIREMGTHGELLRNKGLYYRLYQLQYRDQEALSAA